MKLSIPATRARLLLAAFLVLAGLLPRQANAQRTEWLRLQAPADSARFLYPSQPGRDAQDNVYQGFSFQDTLRYAGHVLVGTRRQQDVAVVKVSPTGQYLWSWQPAPTPGWRWMGQLVTDRQDRVLISITFTGTLVAGTDTLVGARLAGQSLQTVALVELSPAGQVRWARIVARPTTAGSSVTTAFYGDLNVDRDGNILMVGEYSGTAQMQTVGVPAGTVGVERAFCLKASPTGQVQWVQVIAGFNSSRGMYVLAGLDGSVYFTGTYRVQASINGQLYDVPGAGRTQAYCIRFTPAGQFRWVRVFGNLNGFGYSAFPVGLELHPSGDFVLGMYGASAAFGVGLPSNVYSMLRVSPTAAVGWTRTIPGGELGTDGTGNIYVTSGYQASSIPNLGNGIVLPPPTGSGPDASRSLLAAYDETGAPRWATTADNARGGSFAKPPLVLPAGDIHTTGNFGDRLILGADTVRMGARTLANGAYWNYLWKMRPPLAFGLAGRRVLCPGATLMLPFRRDSAQFTATRVVEAQLSDSSGSFANPIVIGRDTGAADNGTIRVTIPAAQITGLHYRVRLVATAPVVISAGDGLALTVEAGAVARILAADTVGSCGGQLLPLLRAEASAGSALQWLLNGQPLAGATADTLQPGQAGLYTVQATGSGCGNATSAPVQVVTFPAPTVTLAPLGQVLITAPVRVLTGGSPAGGTWSGPGVVNGSFDPRIAGMGMHPITYSVTNRYGCAASATQVLEVINMIGLPALGADASLTLSPNPARGRAQLTWATPTAVPATIGLYDTAGRLVGEWAVPVGTSHRFEVPLPAVAGLYVVRVLLPDAVLTRRLAVQGD